MPVFPMKGRIQCDHPEGCHQVLDDVPIYQCALGSHWDAYEVRDGWQIDSRWDQVLGHAIVKYYCIVHRRRPL